MTNENRNLPATPNEMVEAWLQTATDTERRWNEYLNQVMGTEAYAQMMTQQTAAFTAMQANYASGMEQFLRAMNIPTRTDLAALSERVAILERRLDALTEGER